MPAVTATRAGGGPRESLPDALRALAMISVLVMNTIGYAVAPWGPPLGVRAPDASGWDALAQGLAAALLQAKGYPMLAFVFGMALWLAARGRPRAQAIQRGIARQRRLLGLGVVHGVFIYFGDILTLYALIGRRVLHRLHAPWAMLRRHLLKALCWALLAKLVLVASLLVATDVPQALAGDTFGSVAHAWGFLQLNATAYVAGLILALIIAAPVLYLCMLAGMAAARLRLLTHRRWRPVLRRWLRLGTVVLLPPTVLYGWVCATGLPTDAARPWIDAMGDLISVPVAALYLMALGLASRGGSARWCQRLAPLGRRTLTLYVGNGVLSVLLLSGAGLALELPVAGVFALCLGVWLAAWMAALCSGSRRWPLEAWMARR